VNKHWWNTKIEILHFYLICKPAIFTFFYDGEMAIATGALKLNTIKEKRVRLSTQISS